MEADLGVAVTSNGVALPSGRHVCLVVTDTGTALTPEERERIFEPAFDPGGLGLGLAAVKGIVEQSGGRIRVDSAPGRGNRFLIAVPETPGGVEPEPPAPKAMIAASGTILLVEDEPEVRAIAAEFLEIEGYAVTQAVNGDHALKVIAQLSAAPQLLITDVVMPGADGREVAEALTVRFPGTPVLFTSGYTDDVVVRRGVSQAEVTFLAKPYTSSTLMAKVREALASHKG
jgi:two-component system cell cycle sensor histidine kinase/response regulator CckA